MKELELSYRCDLTWDDLNGRDKRVRHCGHCDRNVYNLSGMSRKAAKALLEKDGEICVHFVSRNGEIIHDGDPLEQLYRQRRGAGKLLAGALAVQAIFMAVGEEERVLLDPFTIIPATIVRTFGETVEEKYTMGANMEVTSQVTF